MSDVTQILSAIEEGDDQAAEKLLPLVYEELRKLAARKMAREKPGQTLQATALVHEAYLRLVDGDKARHWDSRGHFFAAAAEAMRQILVDRARGKQSLKRGHGLVRKELSESAVACPEAGDETLAVSQALDALAAVDPVAAELVKLRYFAGLTSQQASHVLGISSRTADRVWVYARSFLLREIE
ncbi:MAG: sigma-70 family RNA polymerase sigma factor [Pirellulales bacterium]